MPQVSLASGRVVSCLQKHEVHLVNLEVQSYFSSGLNLNPGDTVFDVGANIGLFTLAAYERCQRNLRVYAFEPVPAIVEMLRDNVERCSSGGQLSVCAFGLSNKSGTSPFAYYPQAPVLSTAYPDEAADLEIMKEVMLKNIIHVDEAPLALRCLRYLPSYLRETLVHYALKRVLRAQTVACQTQTLSQFVSDRGIEHIDLLKVDAEKAELDILRGIEAKDWSKIRQVLVEVHDVDHRLDIITALLQKHELSEVTVEQPFSLKNSNIYNVFATRRQ